MNFSPYQWSILNDWSPKSYQSLSQFALSSAARSTTMSSSPLPQNVAEKIVASFSASHLYSSLYKPTLRSLSLVSKSFRSPAQSRIFSEIRLLASRTAGFNNYPQLLSGSPHLCSYIKTLWLLGLNTTSEIRTTPLNVVVIGDILALLPNINDLRIYNVALHSDPELVHLLQSTFSLERLALIRIGNDYPTDLIQLAPILKLFSSIDRLEIADWYLPDVTLEMYDNQYLETLSRRPERLRVKKYNVWSSWPAALLHRLLQRIIDPRELVFMDAYCHTQEEIDAIGLFTQNSAVQSMQYVIPCFEFNEGYSFDSLWMNNAGQYSPSALKSIVVIGPKPPTNEGGLDERDGTLVQQWLACASFLESLPPNIEYIRVTSQPGHSSEGDFWDILDKVDWGALDRNLSSRPALREIEFTFSLIPPKSDDEEDVEMSADVEFDEAVADEQTKWFIQYLQDRLSLVCNDISKTLFCQLVPFEELGL